MREGDKIHLHLENIGGDFIWIENFGFIPYGERLQPFV